ncbi:MAG: ErfK/YbiS/YcfS/YnhG family protein, partial [Enterovirga sp.]|nr:ErfK/YbiS/YcfS/YnhG family protein [Enterovirga sp.]
MSRGRSWGAGLALGALLAGPATAEPQPQAPQPKLERPAAAPAAAPAAEPAVTKPAGPARTAEPASLPTLAPPGPKAAVAAAAAIPEPVKLSADPRPALGPGTFVATINAAERYRGIAEAGGWQPTPNEATRLKPNDRGPLVAALRARLAVAGDLAPDLAAGDVLDEPLQAALRRFQDRHGLPETGLVGPRTLSELNIPVATRLKQLQASAARLMGSTFPFGERYVAVNIPAATVEAVQGGVVARRYVAIVGKTDRPSPIIAARIQNVNFNPTWTVPVSLIRKDIIPHMRKDPGYLAKMRIRILDGQGAEIDPATIDWSTERAVNYTLRQDPGVDNSLGEIRIDMPNKLAVYMHDTPSKKLFARNTRNMSSGCVRVSGVRELAQWVLEGQPGPGGPGSVWGQAEIGAAITSGQRIDVKVT